MNKLEFRTLNADEIDVRVSTVNQQGCSVLLYKDARVDQRLLDEVVGPFNWQRSHEVINGSLYCTVGIYDEKKQQWVYKQDVGTESYTEKEKGQASDSFKRACFNWGIGRELYTAPFIWIPNQYVQITQKGNGYTTYDKFSVKSIAYDENRRIKRLQIIDKNNRIVYQMGQPNVSEKKRADSSQVQPRNISEEEAVYIDKPMYNVIMKELERTGVSQEEIFKRYKINSFDEMTVQMWQKAYTALKASHDKEKVS